MRPGTFEIVVGATLSPALVSAFEGFTVTRTGNGQTCLVGWVDDQARLNGLLELIGDMTIELVSVNRIASDGTSSSQRRAAGADADA
ncbi:hypothetical protein [Leifsonia sp. NPDC058230]|uniref:hypothetical protein n=1 Tax=Leifsonia sp. NPDC058230 TaxID=3346391 RepID=UPI0036D7EED5